MMRHALGVVFIIVGGTTAYGSDRYGDNRQGREVAPQFTSSGGPVILADRVHLVARSLDEGADRVNAAQAAEILQHLAAIEDLVRTATAGVGPGSCYNEAYKVMDRSAAVELCSDANGRRELECWSGLHRRLGIEAAVKLCAHGGSVETVRCYQSAVTDLSSLQAMALCSHGGGAQTVVCYQEGKKWLEPKLAARLCRAGGALARVRCFEEERRFRSADLAIDACIGV